jgi:hypothetical protein
VEAAATAAEAANTTVAARTTVRRPKRSARGPAMNIDAVAASVCEPTSHPSWNSLRSKVVVTKFTAPVNSDPSKPMRKPDSAMIRMIPTPRCPSPGFMKPW